MDILVLDENKNCAAVIEVKHTDKENMLDKKAEEAIVQIEKRDYDISLYTYPHVIRWGIAFCKKNCAVRCAIMR